MSPHRGSIRPKAVLWDLDGTLLDTAEDIAAALNATLNDLGSASLPVRTVRGLIGQGARVLMERAVGLLDRPLSASELSAALALFEHHYLRLESEGRSTATWCPGVKAVLDALEGVVAMAIVTNKPERIAIETVRRCGLERYFQCLIGGDSLPERKPHPLPLRQACLRLGVDPQEALMVGDSTTDWAAARAVPMPVVLVQGGYPGDVNLESLEGAMVIPSLEVWGPLWARFGSAT